MEGGEPTPARAPLVSVLIVTNNVKDLLLDCLTALFQGTDVPFEVVVVDNASKDGTPAAVEKEFPQVKVHPMKRNVGFGRANNAGLEFTSGRFILLLNPGVMVAPGCVGELADFLLVRSDVGAVGPRLQRPDGSLDEGTRRAFPTPGVAFTRLVGLGRVFPHSKLFARYNLGHLPADRPHEMDAGTSACLMVRRAAIGKVGLFDPAYYLYGEDLDLCYRLKNAGWKIFYVPTAHAQRFSGTPTRAQAAKELYEMHSSMWTFHHKHYADELPAFGNGLVWAAIWARWAVLSGWSALSQRRAAPGS